MVNAEQNLAASVGGGGQHNVAAFVVGNQYLRSASIQVSNTPEVFASVSAPPHIRLVVDVNARQMAPTELNFEVTLVLRAIGQAAVPTEENPEPAGIYEGMIAFAGVFTIGEAVRDRLEPLLLVEAPRLLFPSARGILLGLVREAGFAAPNIQPVDFVALWKLRRQQASTQE